MGQDKEQTKRPLVSVIMAVKNGERRLAQAIGSVLAGGWQPLEIILVDGHSTDGSAAVAESFAEVRYVLQDGEGIPGAYNAGLAAAKGDYIAFLSCDDEWLPGKLALQMEHLLSEPELCCAVCKVRFVLEEGYVLPKNFRRELLESEPAAYIMETLLARRSVFDKVGTFNTEFSVAEDVDWFARVKDDGVSVGVVPETLVVKRIHDRNASLVCEENNHYLLKILRASIRRQRDGMKNS